jgi:dolichol-phosphate mannosyltransferase
MASQSASAFLRHNCEALDLTLVVPTYNERDNLEELFARIDRRLRGYRFEVIVVDDDSPDGTWLAATEFQAQYQWLRVIRRVGLRDLSSAVICGFRHAEGHFLGVMDADLQHDDACLPKFVRELDQADFAVATRRASGGTDGVWPYTRRFVSVIATALTHLLARTPLSDPMSGFFAMRREVFQAIDDEKLQPRGYKVLLYLYSRAVQQLGPDRLRIREVGYQFRNREHGTSKLSSRVVLEFILMLANIRLHWGPRFARSAISHAML